MLIDPYRLADRRALIVGDLMLDCYVKGSVARISPEAPVPVLSRSAATTRLGGAANVALGVRALGVRAELVGLAGVDEHSHRLTELLEQAGVDTRGIVRDPSRCTTVKTRIVAGHQQIVRIDEESTALATAEIEDELLAAVQGAVTRCDVIVLSDYAKGVCTDRVIRSIIAIAREHRKPIIVDPKRQDYTVYRGATLITPNLRELQDATALRTSDSASVVDAAAELEELTGASILITRSEAGMTLYQRDVEAEHLPAKARDVADVSGAGDTVVATLAAMLADGVPLLQAVSLANVAASIAVSKHGTYAVRLEELQHATREESYAPDRHAPYVDLPGLVSLCEQWRHEGLSVGFTNGCFDILHPGHIKLIAEAAALCDRLIVALNSDRSVNVLKGPTRPINDEPSRCAVMAAIRGVAAVVVFDQETPLELIRAVLPDVLIKGGDYTIDTVVGASEVIASGGRVHIAETLHGHSTTAIAARATGPSA